MESDIAVPGGPVSNPRDDLNTLDGPGISTSSRSSFFRLPGEIRNTIYEYALSIGKKEKLVYSPGETKPFKFDRTSDRTLRGAPAFTLGGVEFNQLKYVCRQLYIETKGLEIKYNTIVFDGVSGGRCSEQFLRFVRGCSPSKNSWIHNVIITGYLGRYPKPYPEPIEVLVAIASWCHENPQTNVKYVFGNLHYPFAYPLLWLKPGFSSSSYFLPTVFEGTIGWFLVRYVVLKLCLRDENAFLKFPELGHCGHGFRDDLAWVNPRRIISEWRKDKTVKDISAPNLKVMLKDPSTPMEQIPNLIRYGASTSPGFRPFGRICERLLQDLAENGF